MSDTTINTDETTNPKVPRTMASPNTALTRINAGILASYLKNIIVAFWDKTLEKQRTNMTMKYILGVALVAPFLTASSMAQNVPYTVKHVYQGGPKSAVAHTTRQITNEGSIFAYDVNAKAPNAYRGGPRSR